VKGEHEAGNGIDTHYPAGSYPHYPIKVISAFLYLGGFGGMSSGKDGCHML